MKNNITIIDTGAGNIHSVYKAFVYIGLNPEVTTDPQIVEKSDAIVFPGVGAFGAVMNSIKSSGLESTIINAAKSGKPFLGICVGMQALFESGEENSDIKGLGIFKGRVVKFKKAKKVPHIGWNDSGGEKFYFVHSYYVVPEDKTIVSAETEYDGERFTSIIKKDNLLAVQFHPEKSGDAGLELLKSFVAKS